MKNIRKNLWLVVLSLCFIFLSVRAEAAVSGTCGDNLTWVLDDNGTLTISGTGVLDDNTGYMEHADEFKRLVLEEGITGIGNHAFFCCEWFTGDLIIPDTVEFIGDSAFNSCYRFNGKLKLPANLETIGAETFLNCNSFTGELVIPDSVKVIDENAFTDCMGFTGKLKLPEGIRSIGRFAFSGCRGLTGELDLPDSILYIGCSAFGGCIGLTGEVVFPSDVKYITDAFLSCRGITNIVIPEGATYIDEFAFADFEGLKSITIPKNVMNIGPYCFYNSGIETIYYEGSANDWKKIDIANHNEELSKIEIVYLSSVDIAPEQGDIISGGMCGENLTWELDVNGTLTISGEGALEYPLGFQQYCDNVKTLVLEDGITEICERAFLRLDYLEGELEIPDSVKSIGRMAFHWRDFTGDLVIPDSVTYIGESAFEGCDLLNGALVLSKNLRNIPDGMLSGCVRLKGTIQIPDNVTTIGNGAFKDCIGLTGDLIISEKIKKIGSDAFYGCKGLKKLNIENGVIAIGESAFANCSGLEGELNIPDSVKTIGDYAFSGCSGFVGICKIPSDIDTIATGVFANCTGFTGVSFPESLTSIGEKAFYGCTGITGEITIPAGVKALGEYVFSLTNVSSIVMKGGIETIGTNDLLNMENLVSVTLPNSLKRVGRHILSECPKLQDIYYDGTCCEWAAVDVYPYNKILDEITVTYLKGIVCEEHGFKLPFTDVSSERFYFVPVCWALESGITTGTSETLFSPDDGCTRAQVVTFLWRSAGCPEPTIKESDFTDIKKGSYYYNAVLWAVQMGITQGTSEKEFSPDDVCTRGQIVTFLYRVAEKSPYSSDSDFVDIREGAFYENAVKWAVYKNITNGVDSTHFAPDDVCTRGQIVTFLYRYFN